MSWGESMNLSSVKCVALYHTSEPRQRQHTTRFKDFFTFHFMGKCICIHVRWMFFSLFQKFHAMQLWNVFGFNSVERSVYAKCEHVVLQVNPIVKCIGFRLDSGLIRLWKQTAHFSALAEKERWQLWKQTSHFFCTCRKREMFVTTRSGGKCLVCSQTKNARRKFSLDFYILKFTQWTLGVILFRRKLLHAVFKKIRPPYWTSSS